ncbi:MAG TPA: hypothetical protein VHC95_00815 [Opitutales bacterium]|nr:hypothetical protein [Opitutales bacterium]
MGDWRLTDFNTRLANCAYASSFDYPLARDAAPRPQPAPAPTAPPAATPRPAPYAGPRRLPPENLGHLEQYFREEPVVRLERIFQPIAGLVTGVALGAFLLGLAMVGKMHFAAAPVSPTPPPAPSHREWVGILNPDWTEQKATIRSPRLSGTGYFEASMPGDNNGVLPPKYVYVSPAQAQAYLERLINDGYVTIAEGPPDVVKDFDKLKKLGVTTD